MSQRVSYYEIAPNAMKIMMEMEKYTKTTTIERKLRELIKIRVSQINGCAYCLNMHTADARKMGETEQRIYCVSAWQECEFYTEAEKDKQLETKYPWVMLAPLMNGNSRFLKYMKEKLKNQNLSI